MRNTLISLLRAIIDDEVFLTKYSNNSIMSLQSMLYIDIQLYSEYVLDALKKELSANAPKQQEGFDVPGHPTVPLGDI